MVFSRYFPWKLFLVIAVFFCFSYVVEGQVDNRIPFKHRVGTPAPEKNIFRIRGDFAIIGNTNLTFEEYDENRNNSVSKMIWVDVDGDSTTANSSTATLKYSEENGADPSCSEILYAGLYWAGRTNPGRGIAYEDLIENIPGKPIDIQNHQEDVRNQDTLKYTSFTLFTDRFYDDGGSMFPYYLIRSGLTQEYVTFMFYNEGENRVKYMIGWGSDWVDVQNLVITETDSTVIATFAPITFHELGITISIDRLIRSSGKTMETLLLEHNEIRVTTNGTYIPKEKRSVKFDKRRVKLKGPNADKYTEVAASGNNILYPADELRDIYVGYTDITDYVKTQGAGEYTVADLALDIGQGDDTGYFGHWGIVVVYQNSKMDWRDVTIFDGYSFMQSQQLLTPYSGEILIDGFSAVDQGPVEMKLGIMAGEGDRGIEGDFLEINDQNGNWVRLQHPLNSPNNFFNSSIYTPVKANDGSLIPNQRNPNLGNSPGIDIAMWDIPNPDNSIIANGQSSLRFKYGTVQDVVALYMLAFAVRSYVPDIQVKHTISSIAGQPPGDTPEVKPKQQIAFDVEVRNFGTEAIQKGKIVIPLPHTVKFVGVEIFPAGFGTASLDPSLGKFGSIVWNLANVPIPIDPQDLIAKLTYTLEVTDDCFVLANEYCDARVVIDGVVSGVGAFSNSPFSGIPFVTGYKDGNCTTEQITGPLDIPIVGLAEFAAANCKAFELFPGFSEIKLPEFCRGNGSIDLADYIQPSKPEFTVYFFADSIGGSALPNYIINLGARGSHKVWVTEGYSNSCIGLRVPVVVDILARSPKPYLSDILTCTMPGTTTIPVWPEFGYEIRYYLDNDPNSEPLTSIPQMDMSVESEYVYWISQYKAGECESERVRFQANYDDCSLYPKIDLTLQVSPQRFSHVGQVITYTIIVENIGIVPILETEVSDYLGGSLNFIPILQPNEKVSFTSTYIVTENDIANNFISNSAYAQGKDSKGRTTEDYDYATIYAFDTEFLSFYLEIGPEQCPGTGNTQGFVEINYTMASQTGTYLITRKEDGMRQTGFFSNRDKVKIWVPAGTYSLSISDQSGAPYNYPQEIVIEAPETVSFEVPASVSDCVSFQWVPSNPSDLEYRLLGPDGVEIPLRENSFYELTKSGNYKMTATDPMGLRCAAEKSFSAIIRQAEQVILNVLPFCAEQPFTSIVIDKATAGLTIRWFSIDNEQTESMPQFDDMATIDVATEGKFRVVLTDMDGCTVGIGEVQTVRSYPAAPVLDPLYTVCPTQENRVKIEAGREFSAAVWYLEDKEISRSLTFVPEEAGNYKVVGSDFQGCEAETYFKVEVKCEPTLKYPTALTPGLPDKAFVVYPDNLMSMVEIYITNRWGELIFYCTDSNLVYGKPTVCVWDGTKNGVPVPNGSYALLIRYRLKVNNEFRIETGAISVVK